MEIASSILTGQWDGYFEYGQLYGDLNGEKVSFRISLHETNDGQFHGKCIELEGIGIYPGVADIRGYMEGDLIQFVKEYPVNHILDEESNLVVDKKSPAPLLTYYGGYNWQTKTFAGHWELEINHGFFIDGDSITLLTGTWEMRKL